MDTKERRKEKELLQEYNNNKRMATKELLCVSPVVQQIKQILEDRCQKQSFLYDILLYQHKPNHKYLLNFIRQQKMEKFNFRIDFLMSVLEKIPQDALSAMEAQLLYSAKQKLERCIIIVDTIYEMRKGWLKFIVCQKYNCCSLAEYNELLGVVVAALYEAIDHYIPAKAGNFSNYAEFWVRQRVYSYLKEQDLIQVKGKNAVAPKITSLDIDDTDQASLLENLQDSSMGPITELTIKEEKLLKYKKLRSALAQLPERQAEMLKLHYGIDCTYARSVCTLAAKFKVSRQRISQIIISGLKKLKKILLGS